MELKRCKNGHSYDPAITPECPACAAMEAGHTVPLDIDNAWGGAEQVGKTVQIDRGETLPVNPQPEYWADAQDPGTGGFEPEEYTPTMPKDMTPQPGACRPVTGWLVCIDGAERGRDYRLHGEMNYIGRSRVNDVVFSTDQTVTWERHALIAYDDRTQLFYIAPSNGSSIVRQNGRPVLTTSELHAGDRLEIGSSMYAFVPFCNEEFQW